MDKEVTHYVVTSATSRCCGKIQHNNCASLNYNMADVLSARTANIFKAPQKVSFFQNKAKKLS